MTSTEQPDSDALCTWLADQFIAAAGRTASDLRGLAEMIEANARLIRQVPSPQVGSAGCLAARIVAQVTAGLATAGLDAVVSAATRYDTETKRGEDDGVG